MKLWLKVTKDELELPIAVADTAAELGRMLGVSADTIRKTVCMYGKGGLKTCSYRKVVIGDDEKQEE